MRHSAPSVAPHQAACGRRVAASALVLGLTGVAAQPAAAIEEYTKLGAGFRGNGKTKSRFNDFNLTDSGLQFKDFKLGNGELPKQGDRVVIDWDGYGPRVRPCAAHPRARGVVLTRSRCTLLARRAV